MWERWRRRLAIGYRDAREYLTQERPWGRTQRLTRRQRLVGAAVAFWDFAAPQRHRHVYTVYHRVPCTVDEDAHLDSDGAHMNARHIASSHARAKAWMRAHPVTDGFYEIWEEAVDAYNPFERADDEGDFWYYGPHAQPWTSREADRALGYDPD